MNNGPDADALSRSRLEGVLAERDRWVREVGAYIHHHKGCAKGKLILGGTGAMPTQHIAGCTCGLDALLEQNAPKAASTPKDAEYAAAVAHEAAVGDFMVECAKAAGEPEAFPSKIHLKRDADFEAAFAKFTTELKSGETTSEIHGFCSGWIAHRALTPAAADLRTMVEALATSIKYMPVGVERIKARAALKAATEPKAGEAKPADPMAEIVGLCGECGQSVSRALYEGNGPWLNPDYRDERRKRGEG